MQVRLLGTVEVDHGAGTASVPGPQLRGLLAALALQAGTTVSTSQLMASLWGDDPPAPSALQVAVSKLRRVLVELGEADRVVGQPAGYRLALDPAAVDALRFESLLDLARARRSDPEAAIASLEEAIGLWSGEPLGGVPDTPAFGAARARLQELHRVANDDLAAARLERGEHARVVPDLEELVSQEPLRERRWALLLRALYGAGRQADALAAYARARNVLVEEAGTEPGTELRGLYELVLAQDASLDVPDRAERPVAGSFRRLGNLRHPVDRCIGRDPERAALAQLLGERRLVTIVGPGGVGKTKLAVELAVEAAEAAPDGVWWVDLAPAGDAEDVVGAVQRALGVADSGSGASPLDAVAGVLEDRSAVLVVDNCEHVLAAVASVLDELLARCPDLRALATSREALRLAGESAFPLAPLRPEDAAALFQERVVLPIDGDLEADGLVDAICRKLDCLPLAVELAAARAQHLRLDELLGRLEDRFDLLGDGHRGAPSHQRGLAAVADWSYGLLDQPEQRVFERLSVFADGATVDAARAVCAGSGVDGESVEALLRRLVDKSLVVADRAAPVTRYRMLQTLRDFAAGRLDARGDADEVRRAHATWVRHLASTAGWRARVTGPTVAAIHDEDVAVAAALAWAHLNEPALVLEICDHLAPYWFGAMRVSTGWEHLSAAIVVSGDVDPPRRASLLGWALVFATLVQELDLADVLAEEAWRFELDLGDRERLGRLCLLRGIAAGYRPESDVRAWVSLAREHLEAADVAVGLGYVHFAEGAGLLVAGELEAGAAGLRSAIDVFRQEDDHLGLVLAVSRLGELAWRIDDIDLFADMHAELLELGRASRTQGVVAGATARLALARLRQGAASTASEMARSALAATSDTFMPVVNGYAFRTAGLVDLHAGRVEAGRTALASAIEAFEGGAGSVGTGQAALCWIDLAASHLDRGELAEARSAADAAGALAEASGDPWVVERAAACAGEVAAAG